MLTSTPAGGLMSPKWTLNPCANISVLPADSSSRSSFSKSSVCDVSGTRSEEHTSELQSPDHLVCRLLLEKKKQQSAQIIHAMLSDDQTAVKYSANNRRDKGS